ASNGRTSFDVITGSMAYRQTIDEDSAFGLGLLKSKSEITDNLSGCLSYSRKLIEFLSFGIDIKSEAVQITAPDEKTGQSTGLDVNFLYNAVPDLSIGIKIADVLSSNIEYDDDTSTPVSSTLKGGVAGKWLDGRVLWAVDLSRGGSMTVYNAGVEGKVLDWLTLRGGIEGGVNGEERTLTLGAGFIFSNMIVDVVHEAGGSWSGQEVSLGLVF
ncbi:MAG: hypothetical protein NT030_05605, partial [Candidatus Saganbacteria bacterium]|nr:hypothetical protein [Candidatus Saganbacteria bacterium]